MLSSLVGRPNRRTSTRVVVALGNRSVRQRQMGRRRLDDFASRWADEQRPTVRSTHGYFLHGQEADPQELWARSGSRADAESDRGSKEFVRSFLANGGRARAARQCRVAGSLSVGLSDPRFFGTGATRVCPLRTGDTEIRRR